jgi:Putative bacterial sensory transduction regulator
MKLRILTTAVASAVSFGTAPAAHATDYNGLTMAQLKSIFTAAGQTVTDVQPGFIRITDGPIIQLTQCPATDNGKCYEIQVTRTFSNVKPTLQAVNQWNYNTKIPEASVDPDGDLHLEFWVTTVGMSDQLLLDSITWFEGAWQDPDAQNFWQPYTTPGT